MTKTSLATLAVLLFCLGIAKAEDARKPYIVHMITSMKPNPFTLHEHWYASILHEISGSHSDPSHLLYTYDKVLHGFAALLTPAEAKAMESMDSCLAAIPSSLRQIHTTHSPQFLGLNNGLWSGSNYGKDVIVGMIDSGIWPESKSFDDRGLGPVPSKWKGQCQAGEEFRSEDCNRKIIGARYFVKGYEARVGPLNRTVDRRSPTDTQGHGTHTASTVAGSAVPEASYFGFANGTAVGMAPQARLAIYKVLWGLQGRGDDVDIAAAMEQSVADGVDIISLSLGTPERPFHDDHIAIAAFEAVNKGVFVSASAGNAGPAASSVENTSPWVTTVAAGTMDREFPAPVVLGNLEMYRGSSLYRGVGVENLPLVYGERCHVDALDPIVVKGKVVLCEQGLFSEDYLPLKKGMVVKEAGGAGMIVANEEVYGAQQFSVLHVLPASSVSFDAGKKIKAYMRSTAKPTATIRTSATATTVVGNVAASAPAPIVATFSGRGPSLLYPQVIKPDIVAPGVSILAATGVGYSLGSGTSFACPHVSGVAALLRAVHPSWSPAAIKSALMTSSTIVDDRKLLIRDAVTLKAAGAFVTGAGHVNPGGAVDPGLVYDMAADEYLNFLCGLNYSSKQIALLAGKKSFSCGGLSNLEPGDLNYPSFSVVFRNDESVQVKRRTVTNIGGECTVYEAMVKRPGSVKITVEPKTLAFKMVNEKLSFSVRFESRVRGQVRVRAKFGEISWNCIEGGRHVVRSRVAIRWVS